MADLPDLAQVTDVENAWRPLTNAERSRALHYIGQASRMIRRRWRDVDQRIEDPNDRLTAAEVSDVVVALVLSIVPSPTPGARSWSQTTGPFAHSVTLPAAEAARPMTLLDWMVAVFEGEETPTPVAQFSFPDPPPFDNLFVLRE
ncbi:Gp19/Gp15/Gp42 family protein [Brevibacterium sp.]|uniref:Gp19/Gp15/Gp42 family protein n=1 Tax=Brevibacterium sp. TaxID=1701 RepID=UPI002810EE95|nr:Gp19/Gp15/Gp42 family protein [Brevibacterium sp.]